MQDAALDLHGPEQQGLAGVACRHVSLLDGHPDIVVLGGGVDSLGQWGVVSCRAAAPALLVGAVGPLDVVALIRLATGESSADELLRLLLSSAPLVASTWRLAMALTRRVTAAAAISNGEPQCHT